MAILPPEDPAELRSFVDRLTDNGWPVAPIVAGEKGCKAAKWERRAFAADEFVRRRLKDGYSPGVGLRLRGLVMIDIDADNAETASWLRGVATAILGETPMVRAGRAPRVALFFRIGASRQFGDLKPRALKGAPVEIRTGRNHLGVAFGRHPTTGRAYAWEAETPLDMPLDRIPAADPAKLEAFRRAVEARFGIGEGLHPSASKKIRPEPAVRRGGGKAADGRAAILRDAVCAALGRALATGRPIDRADVEGEAWDSFATAADLTTRKGNGRGFWTRADVARVVGYALRPDRVARISPTKPARTWTADACRAFLSLIRRDPRCSAAASEVARVMLASVNPGRDPREVCSRSSESIGDQAGVSAKVARELRRKLIRLGYFLEAERGYSRSPKGKAGKATVVRPNPAMLSGAVFGERSDSAGEVVELFPNARKASLANIVQVAVPPEETSGPAPSKRTEPFYHSISPLPCSSEQGDLFGPATPIGIDHVEFGAWLRSERKRLGLSQAALGALIGLKQPHMANVERGHDGLAPDRRRQLIEALQARGAA